MFDSAGSERPKNFAPYAGLISATLTAISVCQLPVARFSSWGAVLGFAVMLVFLVFLAAFVSHLGFYRRNRTSSREASWNVAARGAVTTLWLAPLVLLVRENSPWALPATAIFVATLGVSLRTESDRFEPLAQTSLSFTNELEAFRLLEFPNGFRPAFAFGAVLCAEAGAFAAMVDHILAGALLVAIGSAAWAYTFRDTLARFSDETDAIVSRGVRTGSLAILITAVALLPFLIRGHGSSGSHFAGSQSSQKRSQPPRGFGDSDRDAYVGIVLWPKQEVTKLVAPRISVDKGASGHSRPFVIPFAGVYWFFKAPSVSLPPEPRIAGCSLLLPRHTDTNSERRPVSRNRLG